MSEKREKAKFKLGQKVYHINYGFISCDIVKSIFWTANDNVRISFCTSDFKKLDNSSDFKYSFDSESTYDQSSLFPTREALMKNLKAQEVSEDD